MNFQVLFKLLFIYWHFGMFLHENLVCCVLTSWNTGKCDFHMKFIYWCETQMLKVWLLFDHFCMCVCFLRYTCIFSYEIFVFLTLLWQKTHNLVSQFFDTMRFNFYLKFYFLNVTFFTLFCVDCYCEGKYMGIVCFSMYVLFFTFRVIHH